MQPEGAIVPCDGCTLCCREDVIILFPDLGDRLSDYESVPAMNPLNGEPCHMIPKKDGVCLYLGPAGCKIWEKRPVLCREFDCRKAYRDTPRATRRRMVREGMGQKAIFDAGRDRLWSLPDD